ncbi:hypothetical protein ACFL1A_00780 [Patescibacteria group bacterium]
MRGDVVKKTLWMIIILIMVLALFLAACGASATEAPSEPTLVPTETIVPSDTPSPEPTPSIYNGVEIVSVEGLGQIEGMPPGFGGTGRTKDVLMSMRDQLNAAGYSPVVYQNKVSTEFINGIRLCIMPGPIELFDPDLPGESEDLLGVESGIAHYGVSGGNPNSFDDDILLSDVVLAVTITDQPENVTCVMGRANTGNSDNWLPGTLRVLLVDTVTGEIVASTQGAYKPEENVHLSWTDTGPVVMEGESQIEFTYPTPTSSPPPTTTPVPTATPKPILDFGPEYTDYDFRNQDYGDPETWPVLSYQEWDSWHPYLYQQGLIVVPDEPMVPCNFKVIEYTGSGEASVNGKALDFNLTEICNQLVRIAGVRVLLYGADSDPANDMYLAKITYAVRSQSSYPNGNYHVLVDMDTNILRYKVESSGFYNTIMPQLRDGSADALPIFGLDTNKQHISEFSSIPQFARFYYGMQYSSAGWKNPSTKHSRLIEAWFADVANPPYGMDGENFPAYYRSY